MNGIQRWREPVEPMEARRQLPRDVSLYLTAGAARFLRAAAGGRQRHACSGCCFMLPFKPLHAREN